MKLSAGKALQFANTDTPTKAEFIKKYPKILETDEAQWNEMPYTADTVYFRKAFGAYYKKVHESGIPVHKRISSCFFDHLEGDSAKADDRQCIDEQVPMIYLETDRVKCLHPFIGERRHNNSTLKVDGIVQKVEKGELNLMFCFAVGKAEYEAPRGTITSYLGTPFEYDHKGIAWGKASLAHWGTNGIFNRFYKRTDACLRNSFGTVTCKLRLPVSELMKLKFTRQYLIKGQPIIIKSNKYAIGNGAITFDETEVLTTRLLEPVDIYVDQGHSDGQQGKPFYYWEMMTNIAELQSKHSANMRSWLFFRYIGAKPALPAAPSEAEFNQGGKFHQTNLPVSLYGRLNDKFLPDVITSINDNVKVWFEPKKIDNINRAVFYWELCDNRYDVCYKHVDTRRSLDGSYYYTGAKPPTTTDLGAASSDDFLTGKKTNSAVYPANFNAIIIQAGGIKGSYVPDNVSSWFEVKLKTM